MAGKGWTVGRVAEVAGFARSSSLGRDERVSAHVLVGDGCPRPLARAVREALMPVRPSAEVVVCPLEGACPPSDAPDVAVALVGPSSGAGELGAYARAGVPVAVVVEGALEAPRLELEEGPAALVHVIAASSPNVLADKLAVWLASATDKELAFAASFPFCRRAVVDRLVGRCAVENAVVGAVPLIPGSDLPVMTAKQLKLALDVAAAYGRPMEPARALELACVAAAGMGWRSLARALLAALPGAGALLRAGVAYAGTLATGSALRLRLDPPQLSDRRRNPSPTVADAPVLLSAREADDGYVTVEGELS